MVTSFTSAVISGVNGLVVSVEADLSRGMPGFHIIGLADTVVKEAKDRVRTAIRNAKLSFPKSRVTVNFVPADIKKDGSQLDLSIALAILMAEEGVQTGSEFAAIGELGLGAQVLGVKGIIPLLIALQEKACKKVIIPAANLKQAKLLKNLTVYPVEHLSQAYAIVKEGGGKGERCEGVYDSQRQAADDFSEISGQFEAKRALEIAAAGGHNVLLMGPPGSGKSMLAKRMPGIMPDLSYEEVLELTKIYSVSKAPILDEIVSRRPFRSPHHSSSLVALCGGSEKLLPGEITLAHRGILFLDELPEYRRSVIESIRQPLEDKYVNVSRASGSVKYPAFFILIAAFNPCPCGFYRSEGKQCSCSPIEIRRYQAKISGPILDRFDIQVVVNQVPYEELRKRGGGEKSARIRERVERARQSQQRRYRSQLRLNGDMSNAEIQVFSKLEEESELLLESAYKSMGLSARAMNSILKISRTVADLDGAERIEKKHLIEAMSYRRIDRELFYE